MSLPAKEQDRVATLQSTVTAIINTTNLASSITILTQALDNHALKHHGRIVALAYSNIAISGVLILFCLALAVANLPDHETDASGNTKGDAKRYSMKQFYCFNYVIAAMTAASTGVSLCLVAFSGTNKSVQ